MGHLSHTDQSFTERFGQYMVASPRFVVACVFTNGGPFGDDGFLEHFNFDCDNNDDLCSNGLFCGGIEKCLNGTCQPSTGENPCDRDELCVESTQTCFGA